MMLPIFVYYAAQIDAYLSAIESAPSLYTCFYKEAGVWKNYAMTPERVAGCTFLPVRAEELPNSLRSAMQDFYSQGVAVIRPIVNYDELRTRYAEAKLDLHNQCRGRIEAILAQTTTKDLRDSILNALLETEKQIDAIRETESRVYIEYSMIVARIARR